LQDVLFAQNQISFKIKGGGTFVNLIKDFLAFIVYVLCVIFVLPVFFWKEWRNLRDERKMRSLRAASAGKDSCRKDCCD
jgi:hypothetical protein